MIFESHAHYDDKAFNEDREEILTSLPSNNIAFAINVSADFISLENTKQLMEEYAHVYGAFGIHPSEVSDMSQDTIAKIRELCNLHKAVAIGEIGLDYYWPEPGKEVQKKWFVKQLDLALDMKKPVIIHSRDAAKDTLDILKLPKYKELKGVIHCYSYTKEIAREYIELGYYFGIGGVVTFSNAKKLQEAVAYIPIERILLETDCPYLAPNPNRGKRNSSLNLCYVAEKIAEIKSLTIEEVEDITMKNAKKLFQLED